MTNDELKKKTPLLRALMLLLVATVPPLAAGPASAAADVGELRIQPAERSPAAVRAMMLSATRAGKRLVAVGDHGIVLLSDDDGASFRQARSVPVRSTLTGVYFSDARTGWAVGQWGVILKTEDGGEAWQLQRSDLSVDQPLFSVYFKSKERGYAVGLWSLLLTTLDGGKTWERVRLPPPPDGGKADRNLFKIFADTKGTLFVAAEQGTVLRSDDGTTWTYVNTGYKGSFWTGIALRDGTLLVGGLRGTIYRSTDRGRTWRETPSGVQSSITDFVETVGGVVAVGLDGVVLSSTDGGAVFKPFQREDRLPLTAVTATESNKIVAFSKQGVVADFKIDSPK